MRERRDRDSIERQIRQLDLSARDQLVFELLLDLRETLSELRPWAIANPLPRPAPRMPPKEADPEVWDDTEEEEEGY